VHVRLIAVIVGALAALYAGDDQDRYPQARALLLTAAHDCDAVADAKHQRGCREQLIRLLARAGYLADAEQQARHVDDPFLSASLAIAHAVYGDAASALAAIQALKGEPRVRSEAIDWVATALWRLNRNDDALKALALAETSARQIEDAQKRANELRSLAVQKDAFAGPPANPLSADPSPPPHTAPSPVEAFPITVAGFRDPDPQLAERRQRENEPYLEHIYAALAKDDFEGALAGVNAATSDFQKALGLATIAHLALQVKRFDIAEQSARAIPDDKADATLARAELLAVMMTHYSKDHNDERALRCFQAAHDAIVSVSPALAYGRAVVMAELAAKQAEDGFPPDARKTFEEASRFAEQMPPDVLRAQKGIWTPNHRFRGDAFDQIMIRQLRAGFAEDARRTAHTWRESEGARADLSIGGVWMGANQTSEAVAFARSLPSPMERAEGIINIARDLLDSAGAPTF